MKIKVIISLWKFTDTIANFEVRCQSLPKTDLTQIRGQSEKGRALPYRQVLVDHDSVIFPSVYVGHGTRI